MEAAILALVATIGGCFFLQILLARPEPSAAVQRLPAELAAGLVIRRDRNPGRHGDAAQPVSAFGAGAVTSDRPRPGQQGPGLQVQSDRLGAGVERGVLRQRGDFGSERRGLPRSGRGRQHRGSHRLLPSYHRARRLDLVRDRLALRLEQSSTLTGTLAGQIIMEGYLDLKVSPWLRRMITRSLALIPAVLTIVLVGEQATQHLLVLSQVVLSLQLAFAVIPLIHFTSNRRNMEKQSSPRHPLVGPGARLAVGHDRSSSASKRQAGL